MSTLKVTPQGGTPREVAKAISQLIDGKINSVDTVTLTANSASTTVSDPRVGDTSVVLLMPQTAHAAAEIGNGTLYIDPASYVSGTSFTITHANNSQADRTFGYAILG